MRIIGHAPATVVSGGNSSFVGSLIGAYATCNGLGATNASCPPGGYGYFSRWRYFGLAQEIDFDEYAPAHTGLDF